MDHVIVRLKRLKKKPYRKLLSDTTLYQSVDLNEVNLVTYSPDHNLDEDSWFQVEEFSKKDFFLSILANPADTKDFDNLEKLDFSNINCILALQDDDVYFQKITPAAYIRRKFIGFGETATLERSKTRLLVKDIPDAVYLRGCDTLIFKDIASISSVFKGIDQLYKEATNDEVEEFLESDFISLEGDYDIERVSKPNRKRIALVSETLRGMTPARKTTLLDYLKEYCVGKLDITKESLKITISNDKELKLVLYGMGERFYTTIQSKEKRLANSVERLD